MCSISYFLFHVPSSFICNCECVFDANGLTVASPQRSLLRYPLGRIVNKRSNGQKRLGFYRHFTRFNINIFFPFMSYDLMKYGPQPAKRTLNKPHSKQFER